MAPRGRRPPAPGHPGAAAKSAQNPDPESKSSGRRSLHDSPQISGMHALRQHPLATTIGFCLRGLVVLAAVVLLTGSAALNARMTGQATLPPSSLPTQYPGADGVALAAFAVGREPACCIEQLAAPGPAAPGAALLPADFMTRYVTQNKPVPLDEGGAVILNIDLLWSTTEVPIMSAFRTVTYDCKAKRGEASCTSPRPGAAKGPGEGPPRVQALAVGRLLACALRPRAGFGGASEEGGTRAAGAAAWTTEPCMRHKRDANRQVCGRRCRRNATRKACPSASS
jgi:hypothetical protein